MSVSNLDPKLGFTNMQNIDLGRMNKPIAATPKLPSPQKLSLKPLEVKPKVDTGFKSVDLGKSRPSKLGVNDINFRKNFKVDSGIYDSGFRDRINKGLKGTLKSYSDRSKVANLFWKTRGGGTNRSKMKYGLQKLEQKGELRYDQVKAIRQKFGI